jgi:hypothetical protein
MVVMVLTGQGEFTAAATPLPAVSMVVALLPTASTALRWWDWDRRERGQGRMLTVWRSGSGRQRKKVGGDGGGILLNVVAEVGDSR